MSEFVDFQNLSLPKTPNTYLMAPSGLCKNAESHADAARFPHPPELMLPRILEYLTGQPRISDLHHDTEKYRVKYVEATPVFRFKDDIDIAILPAGEECQLAIFSRSRIGFGDMSKNRKRVQALVENLKD